MIQQDKGFLITLEGIDGSGKTTLANYLAAHLQKAGYEVLCTREPGGTPLGSKIRALVQDVHERPDYKAEFLLFAADRAHHVTTVIRPALHHKKIVIADRMADSSLAYQGYGRGLDCAMINQVNAWVMDGIKPDITLYITIDADTALARRVARGGELSAFEDERRDFFERVIKGFDTIFDQAREHRTIYIIDGSQSLDDVAAQALVPILALINRI